MRCEAEMVRDKTCFRRRAHPKCYTGRSMQGCQMLVSRVHDDGYRRLGPEVNLLLSLGQKHRRTRPCFEFIGMPHQSYPPSTSEPSGGELGSVL